MKLIAAINKLGYIGKDNKIPWKCKQDLQHFKNLTLGKKLIVGRTTFESMPPLKGRSVIVVGKGYFTLQDALAINPDWVIGGSKLYESTAHLCDEFHISLIDDNTIGDTLFPISCFLHNVKTITYKFNPDGYTFTIDDIKDQDRLNLMINKEAEAIYSNPVSRKERTLEEVKMSVKQGKVPELYLIENMNMTESPKKYHDLVNEAGEYVEVKAYTNAATSKDFFIEKDLKKIKNEDWNKSSWYYLFDYNYGKYTFVEKVRI